MAVTFEVQTPEGLQGRTGSIEAHVQLADTTIFKGTLAMQVDGKAQPAASGVVGSVLLGVAERTYVAGATDETYDFDEPMVFLRGVFGFPGTAGDLPDEGVLGGNVAIADNYALKKTIAANDLQVKYLGLEKSSLPEPISAGLSGTELYYAEIK